MFHSPHVIFGIPTSVSCFAAHFVLPGDLLYPQMLEGPCSILGKVPVSLRRVSLSSTTIGPNMWVAVAFPLAEGSSCLRGSLYHFSFPLADSVCHPCGLRERADGSLQAYFSGGVHRTLNSQASTHMSIQSLTKLAFSSQPFPMADYSPPPNIPPELKAALHSFSPRKCNQLISRSSAL